MTNFDQLTLLDHQWNDFSYRLKTLVRLSSQYEPIQITPSKQIHFDSSLLNSKQRIITNEKQHIQLDLLIIEKTKNEQIDKSITTHEEIQIDDNIFEKANKRLDAVRTELVDMQLFLDSVRKWNETTLQSL